MRKATGNAPADSQYKEEQDRRRESRVLGLSSKMAWMPFEDSSDIGFEVALIPAGSLNASQEYQKARYFESNKDYIRDNFDAARMDAVRVSYRDGVLWIIDGKHRVAAILERFGNPLFPIPCIVYYGLTYEQEALYYATQNNNHKAFTPGQSLLGKVEAGDPSAMAVVAIAEEYGIEVALRASDKCSNAAKQLHKIYTTAGEEVYRQFLSLLIDCWRGQKESMMAGFVEGFWRFYSRYSTQEGWEERWLRNKAKNNSAEDIALMAKKQVEAVGPEKIVNALYQTYNYRRSAALQLFFVLK